MSQHQLAIVADFRPEVIERILRVVRHRGFHICAMNTSSPEAATHIHIEMTVSSNKTIDLLLVQLNKLFDVNQITMHDF